MAESGGIRWYTEMESPSSISADLIENLLWPGMRIVPLVCSTIPGKPRYAQNIGIGPHFLPEIRTKSWMGRRRGKHTSSFPIAGEGWKHRTCPYIFLSLSKLCGGMRQESSVIFMYIIVPIVCRFRKPHRYRGRRGFEASSWAPYRSIQRPRTTRTQRCSTSSCLAAKKGAGGIIRFRWPTFHHSGSVWANVHGFLF